MFVTQTEFAFALMIAAVLGVMIRGFVELVPSCICVGNRCDTHNVCRDPRWFDGYRMHLPADLPPEVEKRLYRKG